MSECDCHDCPPVKLECKPTPTCRVCYDTGNDVEYVAPTRIMEDLQAAFVAEPDEVLMRALRGSAIEFARESHAMMRIIKVDVQACVPDYYLELCADEEIHKISNIQVGDSCVAFKPHEQSTIAKSHCSVGGWYYYPPNKIVFDDAPIKDMLNGIEARVFVRPSQSACVFDAVFIEKHFEAIKNGAFARLYELPMREYRDLNSAVYYRKLFEQALTMAKNEASRRYMVSGGRVFGGRTY